MIRRLARRAFWSASPREIMDSVHGRPQLKTSEFRILTRSHTPGFRHPPQFSDFRSIVLGVFIPVLAQRSNPNRCHLPYRRQTGNYVLGRKITSR
jgi:hypothetical protein